MKASPCELSPQAPDSTIFTQASVLRHWNREELCTTGNADQQLFACNGHKRVFTFSDANFHPRKTGTEELRESFWNLLIVPVWYVLGQSCVPELNP